MRVCRRYIIDVVQLTPISLTQLVLVRIIDTIEEGEKHIIIIAIILHLSFFHGHLKRVKSHENRHAHFH